MTQIIGLNGNKQVGKDTFLLHLKSQNSLSITSRAFAKPVYDMLETMLGVLPRKRDSYEIDKDAVVIPYGKTLRHMLQTLGTEWGRDLIHPDIWVLHANQWLQTTMLQKPDCVVFSDVRFNNEANFIRDMGGVVINVSRAGENGDSHASEAGIPSELVDYHIRNTTLPEFYSSIDNLMEQIYDS